jgi:hypothetical protein
VISSTKRCRNCKKRAAFMVHPLVATVGRSPRIAVTGPGVPLCEACVLCMDAKAGKVGADSLAFNAAQSATRLKRKYSAVGLQQAVPLE